MNNDHPCYDCDVSKILAWECPLTGRWVRADDCERVIARTPKQMRLWLKRMRYLESEARARAVATLLGAETPDWAPESEESGGRHG